MSDGRGQAGLGATRRVTIVQRRLTHYRVPLFELLRAELAAIGVRLELLVGRGSPDEESKRDSAEIPWAIRVPTHYLLGGRLCWQPILGYLRGVDLAVVTQENALLANHLLLLLPRKYTVAFWGHGANLQSDNPRGYKERFKRWTTRRADWWFAYTQVSADLVKSTGFPSERITVLDNAADTSELRRQLESVTAEETAALRQSLGFGNGPVGVFIGSLYPEKRLDFLFKAADSLRRHNPLFQFLIVGEGPLRDAVRHYSDDRPWCAAVGAKTGREKALHLALADVMLNPGLVGLGILDSFVAGVPMVTTDCGLHSPEIAYLEQDRNGLMTGNTIDAFVAGVRRVLDDDEYRARLATGGRQAASHYTLENMAKNFANGIDSALLSRATPWIRRGAS